jgi:hypothetical protein
MNRSKYEMTIVFTQIEVGTFTQFFSLSYQRCGHLATTVNIKTSYWPLVDTHPHQRGRSSPYGNHHINLQH